MPHPPQAPELATHSAEAPPPPPSEAYLDLPTTRLSRFTDRIMSPISTLVHWAWSVLALVIIFNVVMRYVARTNFVWAEELQWHIYGAGIMLAIAYGISEDIHVRVDVLASKFRPVVRARIELLLYTLFVLPLFLLLLYYAIPFVENAYARGEQSSAPGGLTQRWIIKLVLILAFALMALVTIGRISKLIRFLTLRHRDLP